MKQKLLVLIGVVLFPLHINANDIKSILPFGIEFNKKLDKAIVYTDMSNSDLKFIQSPPKPVSLFSAYAVSLNKLKKVTTVIGLTDTYNNDDYCYKSQEVYAKIQAILVKKYGTPSSKSNYLSSGALWKNSREYRMSIVNNERFHYTQWSSISDYPNIKIYMEEGADRRGCYVKLIYKDKQLVKEQINEKEKVETDSF